MLTSWRIEDAYRLKDQVGSREKWLYAIKT